MSFFSARSHTNSACATCRKTECQSRFASSSRARSTAWVCYDFSRRHEHALNHGQFGSQDEWQQRPSISRSWTPDQGSVNIGPTLFSLLTTHNYLPQLLSHTPHLSPTWHF